MQLTEQQLFDYIHCPAKYHIKYNMKIDLQEEVSLPKLLKKVSNYFFLNLLNGKLLSIEQLKKKWDSICEQYSQFLDNKKIITGWGYIIKLTQWAEQQQLCIGDVSAPYMIPLKDIQISGNIETILVTPSKKVELLTTNFSDKSLDQLSIDMQLKHGLDTLGFRHIYNSNPDIIKVYSVKYNETIFTNRIEPDITRVKDTIVNISKCIENNLFYPRESSFCNSCTAKQYCKYWHM